MLDCRHLALTLAMGGCLMDLRSWKIPNVWILTGYIVGFWYQICTPAGHGWKVFFAGLILPYLLLGWLFYFRMLGAGDIKLFSVLGCLMGPVPVLYCMFFAAILGAAVCLLQKEHRRDLAFRLHYFQTYLKQLVKTGKRVPYRQGLGEQGQLHVSFPILLSTLFWIGGVY